MTFYSSDVLRGQGMELRAITTAVIGGTLLTGGYGSVVGTAIGLVYPVTTVSIQNAVPFYQVGIAMGALNFFRALASAFAVAVMGAILLAGLFWTLGALRRPTAAP